MCKAIRDLMDDSREEGREEGREETLIEAAKNLLNLLSDEEISGSLHLSLEKVQDLRKANV